MIFKTPPPPEGETLAAVFLIQKLIIEKEKK